MSRTRTQRDPRLPLGAWLGAIAVLVTGGCGVDARPGADPPGIATDHPPGPHVTIGEAIAPDGPGHGNEHDHGHDEDSDLDRPVDELFAARCEHGVATHACEECRYEVGVVAVPAELLERGLVATAAARTRPFTADVELTGEIRFDETKIAHLGPRMPGVVREVRIDLGQPVVAGTPLIEIDSPELAEAEAGYLDALAEHRLAKRTLDRQQELRDAGISSEREYLEAEQANETTLIRRNSDRQKLLRFGLSEAEIAALEATGISGATGRHLLRAPFAGEALLLHAVRGERVELDSELLLFGDTHSLWVWVDLYESHLDAVTRAQAERGLPARVEVRAYPGETFEGRVDFIGRMMDEVSRTVKARITLLNPDGKLRPGMFATVRLAVGSERAGLAVPDAALLSDEGRDFVFVRRDDEFFVRRPVERGRRDDGWVEIVTGLETGQAVVTTGAFLLKSDVLRSKMGEGCAH